MKRLSLILATIALPIDYLMLVVAGVLAYQIRFWGLVRGIRPVVFQLSLHDYLPIVLLTAGVWLVLFALAGAYFLKSQLKFSQEIGRIFWACTTGFALIILLFFFNPQLFNSRFIVLIGSVLAFLFATLGRLVLRLVRTTLRRSGITCSRVLLIGNDSTTKELEHLFKISPGLGFLVVRRLITVDLNNLESITSDVDEIIVGDPTLSHDINLSILEFCSTHHLGFKYAADMLAAQTHNVVIHTLAGVPLIEIKRTPLDGWGRVLKRLFDLVLALILLILLSPFLLLVGLVIYLVDGAPITVSLKRVGESGEKFTLYKFRSMVVGAEQMKPQLMSYNERKDGPLFKMAKDPRVTKLGQFLRRTSIDELLQLWNVLKGNMSLVGPRPHEPAEVAQYKNHHHKLLNIKPGITGLAQISGRANLTFEEEATLDTYYVENWSLTADLIILIKTIVVVIQRKAAV